MDENALPELFSEGLLYARYTLSVIFSLGRLSGVGGLMNVVLRLAGMGRVPTFE